jgi:hypothetical protein
MGADRTPGPELEAIAKDAVAQFQKTGAFPADQAQPTCGAEWQYWFRSDGARFVAMACGSGALWAATGRLDGKVWVSTPHYVTPLPRDVPERGVFAMGEDAVPYEEALEAFVARCGGVELVVDPEGFVVESSGCEGLTAVRLPAAGRVVLVDLR